MTIQQLNSDETKEILKRFISSSFFLAAVTAVTVLLPVYMHKTYSQSLNGSETSSFNPWWLLGLLAIPVIYALWPRSEDGPYYDYNRVRVVGVKGGSTKRKKATKKKTTKKKTTKRPASRRTRK